MIINEPKTKEHVFHRPCPRRYHVGSPIDGIERVTPVSYTHLTLPTIYSV